MNTPYTNFEARKCIPKHGLLANIEKTIRVYYDIPTQIRENHTENVPKTGAVIAGNLMEYKMKILIWVMK